MSDIEKEYIEVPDLPNVVQGDGKYLMTQLRKYLASIARQVNLANGFKSKEDTGTSGYSAPPNFTLTFSMDGGLFKWDDPSYFKDIAYYELRTDTNVGADSGLVDRTSNNYSAKMPLLYAGRVYLYAVLQNGQASNGSILDYNKARPEKPQDINLSKNEQGTLVNFTFIPLDCIGAHIYINGEMYETQDNWLLYTGDATKIDVVKVAYYDPFGEGEMGELYCTVPRVKNFLVERNGATLDFYWDSVGINGAGYAVRVSTTPVWGNGIELFRTSLRKKKLEYPNAGNIYFLIKAYDEHGNFSDTATWFLLNSVEDQRKNIILLTDEHATHYIGNKIGTYYDAQNNGLRLVEGFYAGEYISGGYLPYTARARNWCEYKLNASTDSDIIIADLDFPLTDDRAKTITMVGGIVEDLDGIEVHAYLSERLNHGLDSLLEASLNNQLETADGDKPLESLHCDKFENGRWFNGVKENELTRLKYEFPNPATRFSFTFNVKIMEELNACTFAVIYGDSGYLKLSYRDGFILEGSDGNDVVLDFDLGMADIISFGISQGNEERRLFVKNLNAKVGTKWYQAKIKAPPIGAFTTIRFYD